MHEEFGCSTGALAPKEPGTTRPEPPHGRRRHRSRHSRKLAITARRNPYDPRRHPAPSRIAPADWTAALATAAPHGLAHTLPAGGHMVPITHPAALAAVIEEFLDTIDDADPDDEVTDPART